MSDLTTSMIRQYHANIELKLQQEGAVLAQYVRNEPQSSEKQFYEQADGVSAEPVTTRFAESPQANTPFDRRMVTIAPYHVGDFIDTFERVQTLADPKSIIVDNFVRALGREKDRVIYEALFGTAYSGKEGTTSVAYSTTASTSGGLNVVADFKTANSGLLVEKLIEAKRVLLSKFNKVGEEPWVIVINSDGLSDLLNLTPIQSADYNSIKALVKGEVNTFMGFDFVGWEGYVKNGTNVLQGTGVNAEVVYRYPAFVKSGLLCATGMDVMTRIVERFDRSFHWYAYARAMFGAVRMQENKIVCIERWISG
jgi:hypothetical protein